VEHVQKTPRQFIPLFDLELFADVHPVVGGIDPNPLAPRQRICRVCAAEVFLWGLKDWWVRERKKGLLGANVLKRKDCPNGSGCRRQKDQGKVIWYLVNVVFELTIDS
jgi:E3 ubiquitin-protein ligase CHFR